MTEPPRLLDEHDAFKRAILRSSELDAPSARSVQRAHAIALGVAASTVATVGTAASGGAAVAGAALGSGTLKAIAIWAGVGVLSGALVSGTAVTVIDRAAPEPREAPAAQVDTEVAVPAPRATSAGHPVPLVAPNPVPAPPEVVAEPPSGGAAASNPSGKRAAAVASEPSPAPAALAANAEPSAARYAPVTSDELARELAMVDRARSALRAGDAAGALAGVTSYERAFKRPRFAPEASAIRIEALIAAGRRAEAAGLARSFMAQHPGHPLTPRLREFVNDAR